MQRAITPTPTDRAVDGSSVSIALGPSLKATWVFLCGVLASGFNRWDGEHLFRVLAAWLIADVLLGCVLAQFRQLKRAQLSRDRSELQQFGFPRRFTIPYAEEDSPGGRLATQVNYYLAHWQTRVWPRAGRCATAALAATGVALVLSTYLDKWVLVIVSGSLALAAILALLMDSDTALFARWLMGLHLLAAWLVGHLVVAPWSRLSFALAVFVGLWGYARIHARQASSTAALWFARLLWAVEVLVLLVARQPLLAAAVAVAALAEQMASRLPRANSVTWLDQIAWLVSLLLVALAATYWI